MSDKNRVRKHDLMKLPTGKIIDIRDSSLVDIHDSIQRDTNAADQEYQHAINTLYACTTVLDNRGYFGRAQTRFKENPIRIDERVFQRIDGSVR